MLTGFIEQTEGEIIVDGYNMLKKPKFKCVIVGNADFVARDPETGIYILPITALKP